MAKREIKDENIQIGKLLQQAREKQESVTIRNS